MLAKMYGPKIIIDCGYDVYMKRQEAKNTAEQIKNCFSINRSHEEPFDLNICNADFNSITMKSLEKFIPTLKNPEFPMEVHTANITDVFPRQKLVYLTPHCDNDLEDFSCDDIYVIGGIVDKHHSFPVSLEKAITLELRMARLPLDQYFQWKGGGDKCLTLDQVLKIMLDLKDSGDWKHSLRHVPKRKIAKEYSNSEGTDLDYQAKVQSEDQIEKVFT